MSFRVKIHSICLLLIVFITAGVGCQRSERVATNPSPPFPSIKLPAYEPITVSDGSVAAIKSSEGAIVNLTEIDTDIVTDPDFSVVWLELLDRGVIGVEQADIGYVFCPIAQVSEYYNDGEQAVVTMSSGKKLEGWPILARVFGKASSGEISIGGPQINVIRFAPEAIEKRNRELKIQPRNWFEGWKQPAMVISKNEITRALKNIAVIGVYSGCDQMWIPCKPYTRYGRYRSLLVKNGDFRIDLRMEDIAELEITSINEPGGGNRNVSANGIAKTLKGETLQFTTWFAVASGRGSNENNWIPLGFIGIDDEGLINAFPFKCVKRITFVP